MRTFGSSDVTVTDDANADASWSIGWVFPTIRWSGAMDPSTNART